MVVSSSQLLTILYSTCIYTNFLCASPDDKSIVWSTKLYQPTGGPEKLAGFAQYF